MFVFGVESVGSHIALLEVDVAIAELDCTDHSIATKVDIFLVHGRKPRIRLNAKEGAVDVLREVAGDLEFHHIAFKSGWLKRSSEEGRIWILDSIAHSLSISVPNISIR
jgi:hypothetical protein